MRHSKPRERAAVNMTADPDIFVRAARQLQQQNRAAEAIEAYERLLARWPSLSECWFNLAYLERQRRNFPAALAAYQRALDAGISRPEEVHLNRSVIYTEFLGRHAEAERELLLALALNPCFVPGWLNLANLCEDLGRREQASTAYLRILEIEPHCFEALARYANAQPPTPVDVHLIERLEQAIADPASGAAERASLGFALARLLDAAGQYPRAFAAASQANRASRDAAARDFVRYDRVEHDALIDRLIAAGSPAAPREPGPQRDGPRYDTPRPVFICGMFRSGSSLTEQLLSADPAVLAGGEREFLPHLVATELAPYPESLARVPAARLAEFAARYRAELAALGSGARFAVDKRPDNFLYIGLIKRLFPDALIVHTTRDALDTCLSIYFLHLDPRMSYALDLLDIGHYFCAYRRLMAHWKRVFPEDIYDFDYDALVRGPHSALQGLRAFLGLARNAPAAPIAGSPRAVKTASVWQVREPLYQRSSGRARHYAHELSALAAFLDR
jgi:tetratricopeptide (TPR) repeat protein